jgi:hypothetical protein
LRRVGHDAERPDGRRLADVPYVRKVSRYV